MKEKYLCLNKLKGIFLLLMFGMLLGLFFIPAEAQLIIGAKGGITVSNFSNTSPHTDVTQGYNIGFFGAYQLSEVLSFQMELEMLQQGGQLVTVEDLSRIGAKSFQYPFPMKVRDSKVTINNLNIPLILKYRLISSTGLNIYINAGGSAGINIFTHSKETITAPSADGMTYVTFTENNGVTREYQFWQFTACGGLTFDIPLLSRNVLFDVRYYYGINAIKNGHSYLDTPIIMSDISTNTLSITIGTTL